ncbi:beta-cellobiosidase [Grosmannia clavigera kw1407]|uniref:Glucanase n=1 Tax=Grosmannia clavigera (strain kw1407 / UAMH 11150) TaxID=655863 RepID=F0XKB1_GROCL|nr:beta-cellobiosidase [Grosmannia clavigera kw1407]EFX01900.1 beta-cellobiosidase [Grosmannia clavigera kw1407]
MHSNLVALSTFAALAAGQQVGTQQTETHPTMTWKKCTSAGQCAAVNGEVVVDANWRWLHKTGSSTNCYTGNTWDKSICPDSKTCTSNCAVDGANYESTYGITTNSDALSISFLTKGQYATNIGARLYLMASETKYQMFTLLGNEFTFDVDASKLGCGLNGALYFVSMDEDGGMSKYPDNKAGAKYGTGYCDSQCPRDLKFINGVANSDNWTASTTDSNSGVGGYGSCCSEMDIWEANSMSTAYTAHPCKTVGQVRCEGDNCGGTYSSSRYAGTCDPDGCDFNSYRQGNTKFYGPGMTVDTKSVVTVVTQFIKDSSNGLSAIRRFYVQNGKVIPNSVSTLKGAGGNEINAKFCKAQKAAFGDKDIFNAKGGMAQMGAAVAKPMVLVMSLWDDHYSDMLWLESTYAGTARGSCSTSSGVPATVESEQASAKVIFSNIKFGPINSTFTSS